MRLAVTGGCLLKPSLLQEDNAEVVISFRKVRLETQGLADVVKGHVVFAGLMGNEAKQVQGIGLLGIHFQDGSVDPLGLRQVACLMLLHRLL